MKKKNSPENPSRKFAGLAGGDFKRWPTTVVCIPRKPPGSCSSLNIVSPFLRNGRLTLNIAQPFSSGTRYKDTEKDAGLCQCQSGRKILKSALRLHKVSNRYLPLLASVYGLEIELPHRLFLLLYKKNLLEPWFTVRLSLF